MSRGTPANRMSRERENRAVEMLLAGAKRREVAAAVKCSMSTVGAIWNRHDIKSKIDPKLRRRPGKPGSGKKAGKREAAAEEIRTSLEGASDAILDKTEALALKLIKSGDRVASKIVSRATDPGASETQAHGAARALRALGDLATKAMTIVAAVNNAREGKKSSQPDAPGGVASTPATAAPSAPDAPAAAPTPRGVGNGDPFKVLSMKTG